MMVLCYGQLNQVRENNDSSIGHFRFAVGLQIENSISFNPNITLTEMWRKDETG